MKRVEFYPATQTVIVYLDQDVEDQREAYNLAWKMLVREVIKNEPGNHSKFDR